MTCCSSFIQDRVNFCSSQEGHGQNVGLIWCHLMPCTERMEGSFFLVCQSVRLGSQIATCVVKNYVNHSLILYVLSIVVSIVQFLISLLSLVNFFFSVCGIYLFVPPILLSILLLKAGQGMCSEALGYVRGNTKLGIPCLNYTTCSHLDTHVRAGVFSLMLKHQFVQLGLQTTFSISLFRGKMLSYFQFK